MNCEATKRDGTPCTLEARGDGSFCWAHSPEFAQERRESATRAGKVSKQSREIASVKKELRELAREVKAGEVSTAKGSVVSQVLGVYLRAVEAARKERELDELAERLEALEARSGPWGQRWG